MTAASTYKCPLCKRDCPDEILEDHHLQTRKVDKDDTEKMCRECHKTIHGFFENKELKGGLATVEGLMADPRIRKAIAHIRKLPPGQFMRMKAARRKCKR